MEEKKKIYKLNNNSSYGMFIGRRDFSKIDVVEARKALEKCNIGEIISKIAEEEAKKLGIERDADMIVEAFRKAYLYDNAIKVLRIIYNHKLLNYVLKNKRCASMYQLNYEELEILQNFIITGIIRYKGKYENN